ncbi:D-gluconate kinase, thermostable (plasmid) [Rhodovastum atsumiense]|uniref:gluconokinase n=1 Tax=Rhodovastum atsumiense TaxID=504468 RepID=UPI002024B69C|nr:gluconokinase [Rhodovastum atsumiense]CAH2605435.1 D-gluconate kinase, thermostable [Rhodovastum atsumiense]
MVIVLMGVSGSGKTTVGQMLAERLGCGFSDADSFHPPANVAKMRAGSPLTDEDRWPWLQALRAAIEEWQAEGRDHVLACSALKQVYRDVLSPEGDVIFVYMKGTAEVIAPRLNARSGHYFNPSLLASQFAALEEPADAFVVDIGEPPEAIVSTIVTRLRSGTPDPVKPLP